MSICGYCKMKSETLANAGFDFYDGEKPLEMIKTCLPSWLKLATPRFMLRKSVSVDVFAAYMAHTAKRGTCWLHGLYVHRTRPHVGGFTSPAGHGRAT